MLRRPAAPRRTGVYRACTVWYDAPYRRRLQPAVCFFGVVLARRAWFQRYRMHLGFRFDVLIAWDFGFRFDVLIA